MQIKAIETAYKGYRFRSRLEARWAVFFDAMGLKWEYEPEGFDLTDNYIKFLAEEERRQWEMFEYSMRRREAINAAKMQKDLSLLNQHEIKGLLWRVGKKQDWKQTTCTTEELLKELDLLQPQELPPFQGIDLEITNEKQLWYLPDFYIHDLETWVEIKPFQSETPWADDIRHEVFPRSLVVIFGHPGKVMAYETSTPYAACVIHDSPYFFCECPYCGALGFQYEGRSERNKHRPDCIMLKSIDNKEHNYNSPRILEAARVATSARFEHGEQRKRRNAA